MIFLSRSNPGEGLKGENVFLTLHHHLAPDRRQELFSGQHFHQIAETSPESHLGHQMLHRSAFLSTSIYSASTVPLSTGKTKGLRRDLQKSKQMSRKV
jgi:hypothetical protein